MDTQKKGDIQEDGVLFPVDTGTATNNNKRNRKGEVANQPSKKERPNSPMTDAIPKQEDVDNESGKV